MKKKEHAKIFSVCIHFLFIQNIAASISFMSSMRVDKKFTSPVIQDAKLHEISNAVHIYMAEGSSVHSLVIRGVCMEAAQLHQLNMVTHLEIWLYLEF
jgi:hypothetical protein